MNRYQLATLVKWAGELQTRKRLQKVVYLLQAAGCPLNLDYTLHHYGPYSQDLAQLTDEMVQRDLLCEEEKPNPVAGRSYSYRLSDRTSQQLEQLDNNGNQRQRLGDLADYEALARKLFEESNLTKLEYAATIAYFHARNPEQVWEESRMAAAKFKNQSPDSNAMRSAETMAQEIIANRR